MKPKEERPPAQPVGAMPCIMKRAHDVLRAVRIQMSITRESDAAEQEAQLKPILAAMHDYAESQTLVIKQQLAEAQADLRNEEECYDRSQSSLFQALQREGEQRELAEHNVKLANEYFDAKCKLEAELAEVREELKELGRSFNEQFRYATEWHDKFVEAEDELNKIAGRGDAAKWEQNTPEVSEQPAQSQPQAETINTSSARQERPAKTCPKSQDGIRETK